MDNLIILALMRNRKKKEGFDGQRAITLPRKIIVAQCEANPVIKSAYITDIGYYPKAQHHYRRRLAGIDQNILIYCAEGKGTVQADGRNYEINAGDFFVLPAHTPHVYAADQTAAWTIYWLHFKGSTADAIAHAIVASRNGYKGSIAYNEKREALFDEIYRELERGYSTATITYANMLLWHLLAAFQFDVKFDAPGTRQGNDMVSAAIDFMQQQVSSRLTLAQTAAAVNLSTSHFAALFHKKTGFAPIEYFNHLKIQKACQHLQFTTARMKEIAAELGIEDSYYFSRLFKKLMGVSPVEYRKKFRR